MISEICSKSERKEVMGVHITSINFDGAPTGGFVPGTYIRGRLLINSSRTARIAGINILVEGKAKLAYLTSEVKWFKEPKRYNAKTGQKEEVSFGRVFDVDWKSIKVRRRLSDSETFHSKEKYCQITQLLSGETDLPPGETSYPFCILLPMDLPSSYAGKYGFIRYKLKVKLSKVEMFSSDENFKTELKVHAPKDLRRLQQDYPRIFEPVVHRDGKEFSFLFFSSGELSLVMKLPRSLFVSGETVMIAAEINNPSDVPICSLVFKLVLRSVWIGKRMSSRNVKYHDEVLVEQRAGRVEAGSNRSWTQPLPVPAVQSFCIDACSIIKLYHMILVEAIPEGLHLTLTMSIPIEVSSTPLGDTNIGFVLPQLETDFIQPRAPSDSGFVSASTSHNTGFNLPQSSGHVFSDPAPSNIGFTYLPSAPVDNSCVDSDPPPPYPGMPDSIPSYEAATSSKQPHTHS